MRMILRDALRLVEPEPAFLVHAPDVECVGYHCSYPFIWAIRLHHEMTFTLPDGGFYQVNVAFLRHPGTQNIHAFLIASHEDHEGCWQEFVSCDELLDCENWNEFLEGLYFHQFESGVSLLVTNRDAFIELIPDWLDLYVKVHLL